MDWWIIIITIMSGISFILNGLFLFVLARNKDLVKRKRITYHVANIAVADTLYGLGCFCLFIILDGNELTNEKLLPPLLMVDVGFLVSQAAVFLMTIERSIVISKPLIWNEILPRKRMLLIMLCSWIAVVTSVAVIHYLLVYKNNVREGLIVLIVVCTLRTILLLFTAAVNIFIFKTLRKNDGLADSQKSTRQLPQAAHHQKSMHPKHKASILVLLLAVIMIVTCLPNALLVIITYICYVYKLHCNLHANSTIVALFYILQNLNFLVNPLVYIWKDRVYRNAFYRTFKIKTAQF